jgi:hypothetical protein
MGATISSQRITVLITPARNEVAFIERNPYGRAEDRVDNQRSFTNSLTPAIAVVDLQFSYFAPRPSP